MKKLFLLPILLFLISFSASSQVLQNSNWVTPPTGLTYDQAAGNYSTLNFPTYPVPGSYGFSAGSASVSDMNGNIMMFSDGVHLWKNDPCHSPTITEITTATTLLKGNPDNAQNVIFIPKPGSPNRYYVVTISGSGQYPTNFSYPTGSGLYYSEVDYVTGTFVSNNNILSSYGLDANGNVMQPTLIDRNYGNTSEAITSTLDADGKNYLLIAHVENRVRGGYVFTYKITCNGIHAKPFRSTPLTIYNSTSGNWDHSSMIKVSPKIGTQPQKIGLTSTIGTFISDFNNATGVCNPNFSNIAVPYSYGIEFSPSSNAVYFTDDTSIYGYDTASLGTQILNQQNAEAGLQLGIDGRIYAAGGGVINTPDSLTNPNYVPLTAGVATIGIPQWVHWQEDPSQGSVVAQDNTYNFNPCVPAVLNIPIPSGTTLSIVGWPNSCGITVNTSTGVITVNPATPNGTYVIKYQLCTGSGCGTCSNIGTITINVLNTPVPLTPPQPGPICAGDYLAPLPTVLNGIPGTWQGIGLPVGVVDNMHTNTYTFTPSNTNCASPISITIVVNPILTPTFPGLPTTFCSNQVPYPLPNASFEGYQGTWIGPLGSTTVITQSGTYTFHPTSLTCGRDFSVYITVKPLVTPIFSFPTTICQNNTPFTLPTSSNNNPPITGMWDQGTVYNTGDYTFTPAGGQCANPVTIHITVTPVITPIFNFNTTICSNDLPFILPTSSDNVPPIPGHWELSDTPISAVTVSGTYVFIPNEGYCSKAIKVEIKVEQSIIPTFHFPTIICKGDKFPELPKYSDNEPPIAGSWGPAPNGPGTYTFYPSGQGPCVPSVSVTIIEVNQPIIPEFYSIPVEVCLGSTLVLPSFSEDEYHVQGTWSPSPVVDTTHEGTYTVTFTPLNGNCAEKITIEIKVVKCCEGPCPLPKIHCFGFDPTNNPNDIYENMAFVDFSGIPGPLTGISFTWYFTFYQTTGPIVIHTFYGQNPIFDVFCEQDVPVMSFALLVSNGTTYDKFYAPPNALYPAYNIPGFTAPSQTCFKHEVCFNRIDDDIDYHVHYKAAESKAEISVYPNPAKSVVQFSGSNLDKCSITIYDLLGNMIIKQTGLQSEINIERLAEGVYVYTINGVGNYVQTGKIVKQ